MSIARNKLAIFELKTQPLDNLDGEKQRTEVAKAWINLAPLSGRELLTAQQVQAQTTHKITLIWTPTTSRITSACRMKIAKPVPVNEDKPTDDVNFRIFNIESVLNVREDNRELELMVVEKV